MNLLAESVESPTSRLNDPQSLVSFCDADLLEAWSHDHVQAALAVLVQRYSTMVLSVCRRRCRSETDAEDAYQTTFLYLARNAGSIRHRERLAGWLHRVAQRAAVATTKQSLRQGESMVDLSDDRDDPLDRLTQQHEASVLDEELADLPEHYRNVIVLHVYEGRTIHRLAEDLQTTSGSVRGRLQRGKRLLAQRLRRRGIVPLFAYAAAGATTVSDTQSARAAAVFVETTCADELPDPPVETSLLESLLASGVRLMPTIYTSAGVLGATTLFALMIWPTEGGEAGETNDRPSVTLPAQSDSSVVAEIRATAADQTELGQMGGNAQFGGGDGAGGGGAGGFSGSMVLQQTAWVEKPVTPSPVTPTAEHASAALDEEHDFDVAGPLDSLPSRLRDLADVPVLIDQRGVEFATRLKAADVVVNFQDEGVPLRTALREMLRPHGLKAVVEDEGLVITADPAALVQQGIGVSRWINVDEEAEARIAATLDQKTTIEFVELPLNEAIDLLSEQHELPILLDRHALEEIGITSEEPVTVKVSDVALRSALPILLDDLDLTYNVRGESLEITTFEDAEQKLLNRMYWLEGTGLAERDYQSFINLIHNSIVPDTWETLGGPSTMSPVASIRPAILVSTTYDVHQRIERLLEALRETHFGPDPILERVQVLSSPQAGGGLGGMGGGGMGGGMGGGGMF